MRAVAPLRPDPAELVAQADRLAHQLQGARISTMAYVELDAATGTAGYVCAGHPQPLVIGADGRIEFLTGGRTGPLGAPGRAARSPRRPASRPATPWCSTPTACMSGAGILASLCSA